MIRARGKAGSGGLLLLTSLSLFVLAIVKSGGVSRPSALLDAIRYAENGQFPVAIVNPAAGIQPVEYLPNGLFPEPAEP